MRAHCRGYSHRTRRNIHALSLAAAPRAPARVGAPRSMTRSFSSIDVALRALARCTARHCGSPVPKPSAGTIDSRENVARQVPASMLLRCSQKPCRFIPVTTSPTPRQQSIQRCNSRSSRARSRERREEGGRASRAWPADSKRYCGILPLAVSCIFVGDRRCGSIGSFLSTPSGKSIIALSRDRRDNVR